MEGCGGAQRGMEGHGWGAEGHRGGAEILYPLCVLRYESE